MGEIEGVVSGDRGGVELREVTGDKKEAVGDAATGEGQGAAVEGSSG